MPALDLIESGGYTVSLAHVPSFRLESSPGLPTTPTVFVVDDDVAVRESLELLIRCQGWSPETFASAQEFLNRPRTLVPSCLVLDIAAPSFDTIELQKRIAATRTDMPIICITSHGDVSTTVQAMKAGALGFLTKPFDDDELLSGIREALDRSRIALAHEAEMQSLRDRYASLTRREREVMVLVVAGLLNKQVGGELGISEITVKAHRGQVMLKMEANSFAELVRMATRLGMAQTRPKVKTASPVDYGLLPSRPD